MAMGTLLVVFHGTMREFEELIRAPKNDRLPVPSFSFEVRKLCGSSFAGHSFFLGCRLSSF
jgi:hypothetical protein